MQPTCRESYGTRAKMCAQKCNAVLVSDMTHWGIAFPWCALFINMENLSVSTDYTRYHDKCTLHPYSDIRALILTGQSSWILLPSTAAVALALPSYTRCCSTSPICPALRPYNSRFRLGRAKSHIIFCDSDLNTLPGVYLNAYQNFLAIGMRMHHYLRSWGANIHKNVKFIHSMSSLNAPGVHTVEARLQGRYSRSFDIHMR